MQLTNPDFYFILLNNFPHQTRWCSSIPIPHLPKNIKWCCFPISPLCLIFPSKTIFIPRQSIFQEYHLRNITFISSLPLSPHLIFEIITNYYMSGRVIKNKNTNPTIAWRLKIRNSRPRLRKTYPNPFENCIKPNETVSPTNSDRLVIIA